MYHSISAVDHDHKHPYYQTSTTVTVLEDQVKYLYENGYRAVGLQEAAILVRRPKALAEKIVALTFDDGYQDFYTEAFPILSRYGYSATVFLPTAHIGESVRKFNGLECLTWGQVRGLRRAGVKIGSHTVTHPQLRTLNMSELEREVRDSKQEIEQRLGCVVESFAYPYAFPDPDRVFTGRLRQILTEAGYNYGVTTRIGTLGRGSDRLFMSRLPVNSFDDGHFFRAKLEGAYDWLHALQYVSKLCTSTTNRSVSV